MRLTTLSMGTQQLTQETIPSEQLFIRCEIHEPYGQAFVPTSRFCLVPLASFAKLVGDWIVIAEAAGDDEPPAKPKRRKAVPA